MFPAIDPRISLVCHRLTKPGLKYDSNHEKDDKVWMKDGGNHYTIYMTVIAKKYNTTAGRWEYQLNDSNNVSYSNGSWVKEDDLRAAT